MSIPELLREVPAPGIWLESPIGRVPEPVHKMDPVLKERWLVALRSGNYSQIQKVLRRSFGSDNKVGYCCIGILCNIKSNRHGWKKYERNFGWRDFASTATGQLAGIEGFPDSKVLEFLGNVNDHGYTFLEIANWIEKYL